MTEAYLIRPSLYSQAFQSWRAPPGIWIPNIPTTTAAQTISSLNMDAGGPGHYLTGGGLIRHGGAVYMLTAPDMVSFGGWRNCIAAQAGKKHRRSAKDGGGSSSGSSRGASSLSPPSSSRRSGGSSSSRSKGKTPSSSARSDPHSACQQLHDSQEPFRAQQQMLQFSSTAGTPEIVGTLGHIVHLSTQYGFALVLLDPAALYLLDVYASSSSASANTADGPTEGAHDTASARALSLSDLRQCIDEPELTDFVEFSPSSGDEDTGLVAGLAEYCFLYGSSSHNHHHSSGGSSSSRRSSTASSSGWDIGSVMTTKLLVVQTSSYTATSADCGLWVRRSVASERPFLLGHVVGLVPGLAAADGEYESGGSGGADAAMLVMPFVGFAAEVERVISSGRLEFS